MPSLDMRLSVQTRYKGAPVGEMVETMASDCSYSFVTGDTYLVFGVVVDGRFFSGKPMRPMRVDPPPGPGEARQLSEALEYVRARAEKRPVALLYGTVHFEPPGTKAPRTPASTSPLGTVRFERIGGGYEKRIELTDPERTGFELAVPPGDYRVWVIRSEARLEPPFLVSIADGDTRHLLLGPGWPGGAVLLPNRAQ